MSVKTFFNKDNYKHHLEFVKSLGLPFTIKKSTYTTVIDYGVDSFVFLTNIMSIKTFISYNKILKDIKDLGVEPPEVNKDIIEYFDYSMPEKGITGKFYCVDIKSAYAYAMYNSGFINTKTLNYISKINKIDRLACVGMLAKKHNIYSYDENGKPCKKPEIVTSGTENFFFHCVYKISVLMQRIKRELKDDYIFFWVDGIYFKNKNHCGKIVSILNEENYACSTDEILDCEISEENDSYYISFFSLKELQKEIEKKKTFIVPKVSYKDNTIFYKTIIEHQN